MEQAQKWVTLAEYETVPFSSFPPFCFIIIITFIPHCFFMNHTL